MNKAANTYWDRPRAAATRVKRTRPRRAAQVRTQRRAAPWWLSLLIVSSIFVMLCVSINFRAFKEMQEEVDQNQRLSGHLQNLMDENLALQEEIHTIKTDPRVIEREARRIGVDVKVPVPTN